MPSNIPDSGADAAGDLSTVLEGAWIELVRGAEKSRHPYHLGALATAGPSGPEVRTVVLRAVDRVSRILVCHTDTRSAKVEEIARDPRVTWCFYDPDAKVQLRLWGEAAVHRDDPVARERWDASALHSRRCYGVEPGPGTALPGPGSGLPEDLVRGNPTAEQSEAWFERFAAVVTRVDRMDWLFLRARGHRRARFEWSADANGPPESTWIVP